MLYNALEVGQFSENQIRQALSTLPLAKILSVQHGQFHIDVYALNAALRPVNTGRFSEHRNRFVLAGDHWTVTFNGGTRTLNNTLGTRYIKHLIRNQGKEIHVSDLFYTMNPPDQEATDAVHSAMTAKQLDEMGLSVSGLGDAGEMLTPEGKERIQRYLKELSDRIEDARETGDKEKQATLEEEQEQILTQLAADSGLGARPRKASSAVEQLHKNVTKRIRTDIAKIKSAFPELGKHLDCIKTGTFCEYTPHPKVEWNFDPS